MFYILPIALAAGGADIWPEPGVGVNMVPQQGLAGSRVRTLNTTALKHQHRVGQLTDEQTDLKAPDGHKLLKQIFVHGLNCFYEQARTGINRKSTVQSINQISESKTNGPDFFERRV